MTFPYLSKKQEQRQDNERKQGSMGRKCHRQRILCYKMRIYGLDILMEAGTLGIKNIAVVPIFGGERVQVILITSPKTTSSELMLVTRMKDVITCSARRVAVLVIVCIVRIQQMQD